IYIVLKNDAGVSVSGAWRGLGLRGNASAPMTLDNVSVGIGIAEAAVQPTISHVTHARFEESNSSLADLPTLRAQLARMRIDTDRARAHLGAVLDTLESPGPGKPLMVLEA